MLLSLRILPFLVFILVIVFYAFNLVVFPDEPILRHSSWSESSTSSHAAMNRTLGFQKLLVNNLPSRTDRRDAMTLAGELTGLDFSWIDGIAGDQIEEKVFPEDTLGKNISKGNKGSWRAHMNALRSVVEQRLNTALILEDDVDWDIRLKSQVATFAHASRQYFQESLQGLTPTTGEVDRPLETPRPRQEEPQYEQKKAPNSGEKPQQIHGSDPLRTRETSYGGGWDVLWLGHCGTNFPSRLALDSSDTSASTVPTGNTKTSPIRIVIPSDDTVPTPEHLRPHPFAPLDSLGDEYPPHTRVVHASNGTVCTLAYAVSQQAARKLLWRFGLETFTTGWDLMLRDWCDGLYQDGTKEGPDISDPVCLTVQPPIFSHHLSKPGSSDISGLGGGYARKTGAPYIRLSVRLNMARLAAGASLEDLQDQWPDSDD